MQYEPAAVRLLVQMMDPTFVCTVSVPVPWVLHPLPGAARTEMGIFWPSLGGGWQRGSGVKGCLCFFFLPPPTFFLCNAENKSLRFIRGGSPGLGPLCLGTALLVQEHGHSCRVPCKCWPRPLRWVGRVPGVPASPHHPSLSLPQAVEHCQRHLWN